LTFGIIVLGQWDHRSKFALQLKIGLEERFSSDGTSVGVPEFLGYVRGARCRALRFVDDSLLGVV